MSRCRCDYDFSVYLSEYLQFPAQEKNVSDSCPFRKTKNEVHHEDWSTLCTERFYLIHHSFLYEMITGIEDKLFHACTREDQILYKTFLLDCSSRILMNYVISNIWNLNSVEFLDVKRIFCGFGLVAACFLLTCKHPKFPYSMRKMTDNVRAIDKKTKTLQQVLLSYYYTNSDFRNQIFHALMSWQPNARNANGVCDVSCFLRNLHGVHADWNGKLCRILSYNVSSDQYVVNILMNEEGAERQMQVQKENIFLMPRWKRNSRLCTREVFAGDYVLVHSAAAKGFNGKIGVVRTFSYAICNDKVKMKDYFQNIGQMWEHHQQNREAYLGQNVRVKTLSTRSAVVIHDDGKELPWPLLALKRVVTCVLLCTGFKRDFFAHEVLVVKEYNAQKLKKIEYNICRCLEWTFAAPSCYILNDLFQYVPMGNVSEVKCSLAVLAESMKNMCLMRMNSVVLAISIFFEAFSDQLQLQQHLLTFFYGDERIGSYFFDDILICQAKVSRIKQNLENRVSLPVSMDCFPNKKRTREDCTQDAWVVLKRQDEKTSNFILTKKWVWNWVRQTQPSCGC